MGVRNLSDFPVVFCDSLEVLERAYDDGLSKKARVITASPAVYFYGGEHVEALETRSGKERQKALAVTLAPLSESVFKILENDPKLSPFALAMARLAIQLHRLVHKATNLTSGDMTERRLGLRCETGSKQVNGFIESSLFPLLSANPEFQELSYPAHVLQSVETEPPGLFEKIILADKSDVGFRVLRALHKKMGLRKNRPQVIVVKNNELLDETAFFLANRGFAIVQTSVPKLEVLPSEADLRDRIWEAIQMPIAKFLQNWLVEEAVPSVMSWVYANLDTTLSIMEAASKAWDKKLDKLNNGLSSIVLTNFPGDPGMIALAHQCRAKKIPFVGFQHGVTREICSTHDQLAANYENGLTDLFLTFNDQAAEVSRHTLYARGGTKAVGLPSKYFNVARSLGTTARQPLLYVSTCLYSGYINLLNGSASDIERCERECRIAEDVLAKLPHKVVYKTYPSDNRYADPDPLLRTLNNAKNISIFSRSLNLRYMVRRHSVIITSRATSTVSWCLMSSKPLIFIDFPDHASLSNGARKAFAEGLFLFDYVQPDFEKSLRDLLSMPIAEIEDLWRKKKGARDALIKEFFTCDRPFAGERAATEIVSILEREKEDGI